MRNFLLLLVGVLFVTSCERDVVFNDQGEEIGQPSLIDPFLPNYNFPNINTDGWDFTDLDLGFDISILADTELIGTWRKDNPSTGDYVIMTWDLNGNWTQTGYFNGSAYFELVGKAVVDQEGVLLIEASYAATPEDTFTFGVTYSIVDGGQTLNWTNEVYTRVN